MRFWCNFLGKNSVSAYIYAFCMFDLPHHINVAQGGHKSNLVQYQSIPTWYLYIFLSKRHFQLIISYQYFQGLWYFQDIWPLYAGDLSHGAPLAWVQPAHLWEVPPQVERDHPVTRLARLDRVEMLKRVNRNFWEISSSPKKLRCDCRSRKRWCPLYANTLMRQ